MAKYSFKCKECGREYTINSPLTVGPPTGPPCPNCGATGSRDYMADFKGQRMHIPVHMSSSNTSVKSDFLPSTKDFESPTDPTGEKGMKAWKDDHVTQKFREI